MCGLVVQGGACRLETCPVQILEICTPLRWKAEGRKASNKNIIIYVLSPSLVVGGGTLFNGDYEMEKSDIKKQYYRTIIKASEFFEHKGLLDKIIGEYYGDVHYSDVDKDEIIDAVDYARGMITFERFDEIMREINIE